MSSNKPANPESKLVHAGLLLDTYGELLTGRQLRFMQMHFEEDLSFSEIAREFEISRQAVHDSVRHALRTLEHFEEVLHLVAGTKPQSGAEAQGEPRIGGRQLVEQLSQLHQRLSDNADPADTEWAAREIERLIALLQGTESDRQTD